MLCEVLRLQIADPFLLRAELENSDCQNDKEQNHGNGAGIAEFIVDKRSIVNVVNQYIGCPARTAVGHNGNQIEHLKAGNGQHYADEERGWSQHRQGNVFKALEFVGTVHLGSFVKISRNGLES